MGLTQEQVKAYLDGGSNVCPFCGSEDIEGGFVEVDSGGAWQIVSCVACGKRWRDEYNLVNVVEVE